MFRINLIMNAFFNDSILVVKVNEINLSGKNPFIVTYNIDHM